jgi:lipopolysaccharide/colanic/teichoic acid biosynthesis glycosyltransferase
MSFVGPRPERPEFVSGLERAIPYYAWRHVVRPGLTGWAQITYGYGASIEDARRKLEYDLYYIRHYSVGTDLFIVLRTVSAALRGGR